MQQLCAHERRITPSHTTLPHNKGGTAKHKHKITLRMMMPLLNYTRTAQNIYRRVPCDTSTQPQRLQPKPFDKSVSPPTAIISARGRP